MGIEKYLPHRIARQFKTPECSDFPGVLIPLEHAQRHHSVVEIEKAEKDEKSTNVGEKSSPSPSQSIGENNGRNVNAAYDIHTIEGLRAEVENDVSSFGHDSMYDRKSKVINKAITDMGMGRYQWELFVLCGFGWFADNFWLQGVALTLNQVSQEFGVSTTQVRYTTFALFVGLMFGASFWGIASDIVGRRFAFNTTLFIGGVFGLSAGGAPNWIALCALFACMGLGIGGNLPVDGALFLEFLPFASGNLLTLLSVWWPVGSLVASLIAWGLIVNFSCDEALLACNMVAAGQPCCTKSMNFGWRYFVITLGCITLLQWGARFILFHMFESPKFLLSRGRQAEAVAVIHGLAYKNKTKTWLTEEILNEVGGYPETESDLKLPIKEIIRRSLSKFSTQRIAPLFSYKKLAITTCLLWVMWFTIGMGYPLFNGFLPQYLKNAGGGVEATNYVVYRNYAITNVVGVPGSILACYTVNVKFIGRKGTMAISAMITGIFLFLFTTSTNSNFQLAFSCLVSFFQNIMYGVLYAYTPEVFPAPNRGTGTGISSTLNRIGGLLAPIVAIYSATGNPKSPIYASGALILIAFVAMCALPLETRGKQTL